MTGHDRRDQPHEVGADAAANTASTPDLEQSLRNAANAAWAALGSGKATMVALRRLFFYDIAMARSACGHGVLWTCMLVIFGATSWLLLAGTLIALLQWFGLSWLQSVFFTALASLVMTGIALWRAIHFFELMSLQATRRQLQQLGIFTEDHNWKDELHQHATTQTQRATPKETVQ